MKYAVVLLTLCGIMIGSGVSNSLQSPQQPALDYRAAYERWRRAIDSNPVLGEPGWVSTDSGPAEVRSAVGDLLSIGPNLTPFLVEEMRSEKDQLRLYQLVHLLNVVSGINLYSGSGEENYYAAMPRFRDRFVQDWDSGKFLDATALLQATWIYNEENQTSKGVDPEKLMQIRRYGVFALPFIIESLEKRNSPEVFAAFLIITGEPYLYSDYLKNPSGFLRARSQKLSYVKNWTRKNERRIDKLESLHQQVKALTSR